jgi:hypothetical protein
MSLLGLLVKTGVVEKEIPNCCSKRSLVLNGENGMLLRGERSK